MKSYFESRDNNSWMIRQLAQDPGVSAALSLGMMSIRRFPRLNRWHSNGGVTQNEYESAAEQSLHKLTDYFDSLADNYPVSSQYDVSHAMGVLTVTVSKDVGTYVINKQSPNKQIWLSSPASGPKRYDLISKKWVYTHDGEALDVLLTREFRKIFLDLIT
ncbi:unnamed protein product [Caenorhabditis auriculariae]|uniref:ferroxidase n=1 Tax=Caenorhabditis auriculariae TaxID=2777116 RepID=A0A8S1HLL7_9PELO|nr:unnamed protein product [Caenorhabditis auriculariae]